jgi:hypothetical protein
MVPMANYLMIDSSRASSYKTMFGDPLSPGYLLKNISVSLLGCYHCLLSSSQSAIALQIGDVVIQSEYLLPQGPDLCQCRNCHFPHVIPNELSFHWWPGWNFGGPNLLNLIVLENAITLSFINLTFTAVDVTPNIQRYSPMAAPFRSSDSIWKSSKAGMHMITINGTNFLPMEFRYICIFTNNKNWKYTTFASPSVNGDFLQCPIPPFNSTFDEFYRSSPSLKAGDGVTYVDVDFYVYPDVSIWGNISFPPKSTGPFPFRFYKSPSLYVITPTSGPSPGGTLVSVIGAAFFKSQNLKCRFGSLSSLALFVNSSYISCRTPPGKGTVGFYVTENGFDFSGTGNLTYTYT